MIEQPENDNGGGPVVIISAASFEGKEGDDQDDDGGGARPTPPLLSSPPPPILTGILYKRRDYVRTNRWRPRLFTLDVDRGILTYRLVDDDGDNGSRRVGEEGDGTGRRPRRRQRRDSVPPRGTYCLSGSTTASSSSSGRIGARSRCVVRKDDKLTAWSSPTLYGFTVSIVAEELDGGGGSSKSKPSQTPLLRLAARTASERDWWIAALTTAAATSLSSSVTDPSSEMREPRRSTSLLRRPTPSRRRRRLAQMGEYVEEDVEDRPQRRSYFLSRDNIRYDDGLVYDDGEEEEDDDDDYDEDGRDLDDILGKKDDDDDSSLSTHSSLRREEMEGDGVWGVGVYGDGTLDGIAEAADEVDDDGGGDDEVDVAGNDENVIGGGSDIELENCVRSLPARVGKEEEEETAVGSCPTPLRNDVLVALVAPAASRPDGEGNGNSNRVSSSSLGEEEQVGEDRDCDDAMANSKEEEDGDAAPLALPATGNDAASSSIACNDEDDVALAEEGLEPAPSAAVQMKAKVASPSDVGMGCDGTQDDSESGEGTCAVDESADADRSSQPGSTLVEGDNRRTAAIEIRSGAGTEDGEAAEAEAATSTSPVQEQDGHGCSLHDGVPPVLADRIDSMLDFYLPHCFPSKGARRSSPRWTTLFRNKRGVTGYWCQIRHPFQPFQPSSVRESDAAAASVPVEDPSPRRRPRRRTFIRSVAVLDASPLDIFSLIVDPSLRSEYEPNFRASSRLRQYNDHTFLDYYAYRPVWPTAARDFCVSAHWRVIEGGSGGGVGGGERRGVQRQRGPTVHGGNSIAYLAFSHHNDAACPQVPNHVRANLLVSLYLLEPLSDNRNGRPRCRMTRVLSLDLGGSLPRSVVSIVTQQQAMLPAVVADYLGRQRETEVARPIRNITDEDVIAKLPEMTGAGGARERLEMSMGTAGDSRMESMGVSSLLLDSTDSIVEGDEIDQDPPLRRESLQFEGGEVIEGEPSSREIARPPDPNVDPEAPLPDGSGDASSLFMEAPSSEEFSAVLVSPPPSDSPSTDVGTRDLSNDISAECRPSFSTPKRIKKVLFSSPKFSLEIVFCFAGLLGGFAYILPTLTYVISRWVISLLFGIGTMLTIKIGADGLQTCFHGQSPAHNRRDPPAEQSLAHVSLLLLSPVFFWILTYVVNVPGKEVGFLIGAAFAVRRLFELNLGSPVAYADGTAVLGPVSRAGLGTGRVTCRFTVDLKGVLRFTNNKREENKDRDLVSSLSLGVSASAEAKFLKRDADISVTHIVVKAVARAISEVPVINCRRICIPLVGLDGYYPNKGVDITIAPSANASACCNTRRIVTLLDVDKMTIQDVAEKLAMEQSSSVSDQLASTLTFPDVIGQYAGGLRHALGQVVLWSQVSEIFDLSRRSGHFGCCIVLTSPDSENNEVDIDVTPEPCSGGPNLAVVIGGVRMLDSRNFASPRPMLSVSLTFDCPACSVATCRRLAERVQYLLQFPEVYDECG